MGYGSGITGLFGLIGIIGALAAAYVGQLNDRMSSNRIIIYAIAISMAAWVVFLFSGHFIPGIIIAVILVDLGQQALHITNQNIIFSNNPEARNRINTVYMVSFFLGGSAGNRLGCLRMGTLRMDGCLSFRPCLGHSDYGRTIAVRKKRKEAIGFGCCRYLLFEHGVQ